MQSSMLVIIIRTMPINNQSVQFYILVRYAEPFLSHRFDIITLKMEHGIRIYYRRCMQIIIKITNTHFVRKPLNTDRVLDRSGYYDARVSPNKMYSSNRATKNIVSDVTYNVIYPNKGECAI